MVSATRTPQELESIQQTDLSGLTLDEARERLAPFGINAVRAGSTDGRVNIVTRDYRLDRVTVAVEDGKVVGRGRIG